MLHKDYNKGKSKRELLLVLFVLGVLTAPFTVLFEFKFFDYQFLVFTGPVVYALAGSAGKFYKSILGHRLYISIKALKKQYHSHP